MIAKIHFTSEGAFVIENSFYVRLTLTHFVRNMVVLARFVDRFPGGLPRGRSQKKLFRQACFDIVRFFPEGSPRSKACGQKTLNSREALLILSFETRRPITEGKPFLGSL